MLIISKYILIERERSHELDLDSPLSKESDLNWEASTSGNHILNQGCHVRFEKGQILSVHWPILRMLQTGLRWLSNRTSPSWEVPLGKEGSVGYCDFRPSTLRKSYMSGHETYLTSLRTRSTTLRTNRSP